MLLCWWAFGGPGVVGVAISVLPEGGWGREMGCDGHGAEGRGVIWLTFTGK